MRRKKGRGFKRSRRGKKRNGRKIRRYGVDRGGIRL